MKLSIDELKEIIRDELKEAFSPDYSFIPPGPVRDEEEALHKHRMRKRASGGYRPKRNFGDGSYEDTRAPEEVDKQRQLAMINATKSILMMNPDASLMVDPATYQSIKDNAPELLDRVTVSQRRNRE